jgi:phosphoserine phosphatase
VQHLLASDPEVVDGEFTGRIEGIPCFHEGKLTRLEAWLAGRGQALPDFAVSYFYGDSQSDVPLMEKVTHPVAVSPDDALAQLAQARKWPVISLR